MYLFICQSSKNVVVVVQATLNLDVFTNHLLLHWYPFLGQDKTQSIAVIDLPLLLLLLIRVCFDRIGEGKDDDDDDRDRSKPH